MPEIIVKLGDNVVQKFFFVQESMSIGRAPDNEIVIENLAVSRAHSVIRKEEEHYVVKDLGSSNGTYVNGVKVKKTELLDRDVITIGKHKLYFYDTTQPPKKAAHSMQDVEGTMLMGSSPSTVAEIEVTKGRQKGQKFDLTGELITIGRGPENVVRLSDWFVSKDHAVIDKRDGSYWIKDLDSWRHTMVNGEQIQEHALQDGDVIQLGPTVQLVFRLQGVHSNGAGRVPVEMEASMMSGVTSEDDLPKASSDNDCVKTDYVPFNEDMAMPHQAHDAPCSEDHSSSGQPESTFDDADVAVDNHEDVADALMEDMAEYSVQAAAEATSGGSEKSTAAESEAAEPEAAESEAVEPAASEPRNTEDVSDMFAFQSNDEPDARDEEFDLSSLPDVAEQEVDPSNDTSAQMFVFDDSPSESSEFGEDNPLESAEPDREDVAGPEMAPEVDFDEARTDLETESAADEAMPEFETQASVEIAEPQVEESAHDNSGADIQDDTLREEILMWERALQNKSPLIRKQAARHLKKLTGRDYEY